MSAVRTRRLLNLISLMGIAIIWLRFDHLLLSPGYLMI